MVNGLKPGGLEIYLKRFINFYDKDFISSCIYCKSNNNNENFISSFDGKINIKINRYSYKNPISYYSFYLFLKKNKFDAVCDFSGTFAGPYLLISKILKIKKRIVFFRESRFQFDINFLRQVNNSLEQIVLNRYPVLKKIRSYLENLENPMFVRMTGSGSVFIAYYISKNQCERAQKKFRKNYKKYWCIISKTI